MGGVFRVGFATSQGQTLRPLLFPSQTRLRFDTGNVCSRRPREEGDFLFFSDSESRSPDGFLDPRVSLLAESLRFLCVLAGLTVFAAVYALVICIRQGMSPYKTFLRVFDLFTDAVPPALRAALSVALTAATSRYLNLLCVWQREASLSTQITLRQRRCCLCLQSLLGVRHRLLRAFPYKRLRIRALSVRGQDGNTHRRRRRLAGLHSVLPLQDQQRLFFGSEESAAPSDLREVSATALDPNWKRERRPCAL